MRRIAGQRIVLVSFLVGLLGCGPLLLYIAFGPEDGNPIGLGLLMMVSGPAAAIGMLVGLVKCLIENFEGED